jgi:DNA helicase-2/ATP-dependent DNA helicase PcrA
MKGLEKDIVFIIGMCEGVFPDYRAKTVQEIEEEKNSAFVAVTRARRCISNLWF